MPCVLGTTARVSFHATPDTATKISHNHLSGDSRAETATIAPTVVNGLVVHEIRGLRIRQRIYETLYLEALV